MSDQTPVNPSTSTPEVPATDKVIQPDSSIPSEYHISAKWDKCLENFLLNFSAGLVAGGASSFLLAKSGKGRAAIAAFGAGTGTGSSWTSCRLEFEKKD